MRLHLGLVHEHHQAERRDDADRQGDQKHPVPGVIVGQPGADGRAHDRAEHHAAAPDRHGAGALFGRIGVAQHGLRQRETSRPTPYLSGSLADSPPPSLRGQRLWCVSMETLTLMPARCRLVPLSWSKVMRTGTRCTTLTQLPLAFCGGRIENCAPVPGETEVTVPVKVRSGNESTSSVTFWPMRR